MVVYNEDVVINAPYKLTLKNTDSWWVDLRCLQNPNRINWPGILEVNNHIKCLRDISAYGGALMTASISGSTGGGAVQIGHAFERTDDPPRINLTDYALGERYSTLYITAGSSKYVGADSVLANMKLNKLTATDRVLVNYLDPADWATHAYISMPPIHPHDVDFANGNWANPWGFVTGETVYYKSLSTFGCAKELSDTPKERKFKTVQDAALRLEHEVTKEWRHLPYGQEEGTIRCICGKELTKPCPEHREEWMDIYTVNTGDVIDASALIILDLMERVQRLEGR
jgi:hypothetical protein